MATRKRQSPIATHAREIMRNPATAEVFERIRRDILDSIEARHEMREPTPEQDRDACSRLRALREIEHAFETLANEELPSKD